MASRKDQLHSYQFMMQRVISSMVLHETDPEQTPLRRGVGAVFGGVMLTGLLAIAFGVYGVISNNMGNRWQEDGVLVIERETGAHYLYQDGALQPVLNYASARLLTGSADAQRVPGRNLVDLPRTVPVGIPGAPDSLPGQDRTVRAPWTICSAQGEDAAGSTTTTTMLLVGERVPGSTPLAEQGLLVRDSEDGTRHLIWRSTRFQIGGEDPDQVIRSLYGLQAQVVDAGTAWLNGLPEGPDIAPPEIEQLGEESEAVSDREIGELVYHPVADGRQHYLVLDDGLAHLTELQMLLVSGQYAVEPVEITAAAANAAPTSEALTPPAGSTAAPQVPPELITGTVDDDATLCAETDEGRQRPEVSVGGDLSVVSGAIPTITESPEGIRLADWVLVPPAHVAVVRAIQSETAASGSLHLVTDLGMRYPIPSEQVLHSFGYTERDVVEMPAELVNRIPAGPTLDPTAAREPVPVNR